MDTIVLLILFGGWFFGGISAIFFDIKYAKKEYGIQLLKIIREDIEENPMPAIFGYTLRYFFYLVGGWVTLLIRVFTVTKTRS